MSQPSDEPGPGPAFDGVRRFVVVNTRRQAPAPRGGTLVLVLDTTWTPPPGERSDLIAVRPLVFEMLLRRNLFDESLDVLDDWAARAGAAAAFAVDGVGWWSHARGFLRLNVHELLLWTHLLDLVLPAGWAGELSVPGDRRLLAAVAQAAAASRPGLSVKVRGSLFAGSTVPVRAWRWAVWKIRQTWYRVYLPRRAINRRRHRELAARIDRVRGASLSILAPMREASFHTVATSAGTHRGDPYAGPVLDRLAAEGGTPLRVVIGMDSKRDREWRALRDDDQAIPLAYVARRWPPPPGSVPSYLRLAETLGGIRDVPMLVDGVDLGPFLRHRVTGQAWWLRGQVIAMRVAEGLMADLRPSVMLTGWEASRTAWLGAARRTGVPIVAIQHGVIYPRTPDYVRPPDPAHVRAELTCLFGTYERDLLVNEGGYPPEAVAATGSPRATPRSVADPGTPGERGAIRQQLGVADGDRLLVVSTARYSVGDEFHSMATVGSLLDGPLPGVHVAFKLHPEENVSDRYPSLLAGLAAAGSYPPPAMSVIRDVDLYALLRAADAHLGQYSTVLTDAVVTSTPNMIAVGQAWSDVIGYVDAGVATPVATVADVRAFMANPKPIDPAARDAFLRRHSLDGDAIGRIAEAVRETAREDARPPGRGGGHRMTAQ